MMHVYESEGESQTTGGSHWPNGVISPVQVLSDTEVSSTLIKGQPTTKKEPLQ